jgi:hypothetical protein
MNYDDIYEQINITLGDSNNVTFTPEEKARAAQKAWKDAYAVERKKDDSLTFTAGTYEYNIPTSLTTVTDIQLSASGNTTDDFPESISKDLWDVVDGQIRFRNLANSIIPSGYTLYLIGNKRLDYTTDTVDDEDLQEYLIALGAYNTLALLTYKKANLFLKNDTSMAELISLKRDLKQEVLELRGKLQRSFEVA